MVVTSVEATRSLLKIRVHYPGYFESLALKHRHSRNNKKYNGELAIGEANYERPRSNNSRCILFSSIFLRNCREDGENGEISFFLIANNIRVHALRDISRRVFRMY